MKSLTLQNKTKSHSISVPNTFLDNFMPEANGEFVKIYLYLIRCISDANMDISISMLADKFNHTENDVIRGLRYWEKAGLISLIYDSSERELIGITLLCSDDSDATANQNNNNNSNNSNHNNNSNNNDNNSSNNNNTNHTSGKNSSDSNRSNAHDMNAHSSNNSSLVPDASQMTTFNIPDAPSAEVPIIIESIADRKPKPVYTSTQLKQFAEKEELSQLLYIAQKYLGKTLTSTETNSIIYFYETLNFPSDLIEYLIEYCVSKEHKSMRYIEKVALSWADAGIESVSQAKKESNLFSNNVFSVMKAFGIGNRNPGLREQEFISKWNDIYCFDSEIIIEACNRTIQVTHQPSFEYADSILTKWKDKNVTRLCELKALDEQFAEAKNAKERLAATKQKPSSSTNKFNNFSQRNYDFDELEKQLIGNNN